MPGFLSVTRRVLEGVGARVDVVRLVDHVIPPGVMPDMREHGWERDDFPEIYRSLVEPADPLGPLGPGAPARPERH